MTDLNPIWPDNTKPPNYTPGDYGWAINQIYIGKTIRRPHWPSRPAVAYWKDGKPGTYPFTAYWRVWGIKYSGYPTDFAIGWGGCLGMDHAEGDYQFEGRYDGVGYTPTHDDLNATDWVVI